MKSFTDKELGHFVANKSAGDYSGRFSYEGRDIDLSIEADDERQLLVQMEWARSALAKIDEWVRLGRIGACKEYLAVKNESWLSGGEVPLGADEFKSRLKLSSIDIGLEDSIGLQFEDDGMFAGHSVFVDMSPDEKPTASLYG